MMRILRGLKVTSGACRKSRPSRDTRAANLRAAATHEFRRDKLFARTRHPARAAGAQDLPFARTRRCDRRRRELTGQASAIYRRKKWAMTRARRATVQQCESALAVRRRSRSNDALHENQLPRQRTL